MTEGPLYAIRRTKSFQQDVKRLKKQGADLHLLEAVVDLLSRSDDPLPPRYRDHRLMGNHAGFRECHITNTWILKYIKDGSTLLLVLSRTGTHRQVLNIE